MVYTYTATGQRQSVNDSTYGTTSYSYDNRDRVVQIQQPQIGTVAAQSVGYGYDERSNRTVMTTTAPSASLIAATNYGYDAVGRLQSVLGPNDGGTATTYQYYDNGLRWKQTLPNGIVSAYTYDPLNRLTEITQIKNGATPALADYQYALNGAGNRTAITETTNYTSTQQTRQMNYGYDPAYRLTREKDSLVSGITTTYGYDAVGNRLGLTVTNGITNSVTRSNYNELDQLMTSVGPNLSSSYNYVRGNLVGVTTNGATTAYTWDSADRLVGVALPGSVNLTYGYDADGRRVSQRGTGAGTANNNTNYLWDEQSQYGDVVLESDSGTGATKTSYVLSGSQGELVSQKRAGVSAPDYFLRDAQGSTRALVDNTGTLVSGQNYGYSAFGKLLSGQTAFSAATNYQYTGQQSDSLSGLYDLRARYYNSGDGRFLSQDKAGFNSVDPAQLNRYEYTANSPLNSIDPTGLQADTLSTSNTTNRVGKAIEYALLLTNVVLIGTTATVYVGSNVTALYEDLVGATLVLSAKLWWLVLTGIMEASTADSFRKPAVALGLASIKGTWRFILTISNFYPGDSPAKTAKDMSSAALALTAKFVLSPAFYRIEGGDFDLNANSSSNLHAEEIMVNTLEDEFSKGNLDRGSTTFVGVSKDDICDTCLGLGVGFRSTPYGLRWKVIIDGGTNTTALFFGLMRGGPRH